MNNRISDLEFFKQDALVVANNLIGKILVVKFENGEIMKSRITQTEAYIGEEDEACHAHKGKTKRTQILYAQGGNIYIYLIYGMYYLFNIVTGLEGNPQAVLIRETEDYGGPGKLTKNMKIDKTFNTQSIINNPSIWIEDDLQTFDIETGKRINIDYASETWRNKPWRFILKAK